MSKQSELDEILDDLFNANPETSPLGVIDIAKQSLLALINEEKIKELESLPFTDRETNCMDCMATCMVDDRIKELKGGLINE